MRFRDRKERERYMDSLEQQMENQREQIQRTLDGMEGSSRRRAVLKKLRSSLPSLPGRTSVRDPGEREAATDKRPDSEASRSWWKLWS